MGNLWCVHGENAFRILNLEGEGGASKKCPHVIVDDALRDIRLAYLEERNVTNKQYV